jgi:hypothetical protein
MVPTIKVANKPFAIPPKVTVKKFNIFFFIADNENILNEKW